MFPSAAEASACSPQLDMQWFIDEQCAILGMERGEFLTMVLEEGTGEDSISGQ